MNSKRWLEKMRKIWEDPKTKYVGILVMVLYFIVYLISIDHLFFQEGSFEVFVVDNPLSRMFVLRAPYVWEPVAAITFGGR